jgi:hypothetical protein
MHVGSAWRQLIDNTRERKIVRRDQANRTAIDQTVHDFLSSNLPIV